MSDDASGELVLREGSGHVAVLVLNRPEKRNALNDELREAFIAALAAADADPEVRAIVITGAGEKAFVSGADITEFLERSPCEQDRMMRRRRVYDAVAEVRKPTIAAINGACLGGGLEVALACDIRVASEHAKLGSPEVNLGIIPGGGATQQLPRLIGVGAALRLVLSGEAVSALEAHRLGLVDEVVPASVVRVRAVTVAERIAQNAPLAVAAAKQAIRSALSTPLAEGRVMERSLFGLCFASEDRMEGMRAFLEKRKPVFQGR